MKIGLVTSYYEEKYGGNEYYLAKYLSKLGHKVFIYVTKLSIPRYSRLKKIDSGSTIKNVKVVRLPSFGVRKKGMNYLIGLKRQLKKDKLDVVHVQEWIMPLTLSCLSSKNLVLTQRINRYPSFLKLYVKMFGKIALKKAKSITTLTTESRDELLKYTGLDARKVSIIPNGVDTSLFKPSKPLFKKDKFTILFVGRLSKEKGVEYLLKACSKIETDYRLLVVGKGSEKDRILKLARELGIFGKLKMMDSAKHKDLPRIYSSADVLVIPSLIEPFGFVTLEGLACGVPVIGSDLGGMRDVITKDVGLKVKPRDVLSLHNAIKKTQDNKFRKKLSKNSRKHILGKYSWEKVADLYSKEYR